MPYQGAFTGKRGPRLIGTIWFHRPLDDNSGMERSTEIDQKRWRLSGFS